MKGSLGACLVLPLLVGCAADAADTSECVRYHFTRVLPGSGVEAGVAADGSIVAVSELDGLRWATVLDRTGTQLGFFQLDQFSAVVRAGDGGAVLAAAADGRVRRFVADGSVVWTAQLDLPVLDLVALPQGRTVASLQGESAGVVVDLDEQGQTMRNLQLRAAPFLAVDEAGGLVLTSRDLCRSEAPCGTGFDPNAPAPLFGDAAGRQTSAVVQLGPTFETTGGFVSSVTDQTPLGPLFIRAGAMGPGSTAALASAASLERVRSEVDVDPGVEVELRSVDTEAAPDHVLGFAGRKLAWARGFEPLDDSGRAYVVSMFAGRGGVAVDVNGDVYKTHHIHQLTPAGELVLSYDKPNDGIANDVRLAGIDDEGHIVLSGRFEGTQDFDPGPGIDVHSARSDARRYVTSISACP